MTTDLLFAMSTEPVVLDGGLATQLEAQGNDLSSALWSARLLAEAPEQILEAHLRYYEAGAQVAITASYQASFDGFAAVGLDRGSAAALMRRSVALAREAAARARGAGPRWVAASVGPYGAALADGSEYRGDYDLGTDALRRWHRPRLAVLAESGADVLAFETVPCLAEAEALLAEVDGLGVNCWLSLSCADGRTRAGENVAEAFAMAADVDEVIAVGVNCTDAAEVAGLVSTATRISGLPAVAYPNSGESWDALTRRWVGPGSFAAAEVVAWRDAGARLIGGCCRVTPDDIAAISRTLHDA